MQMLEEGRPKRQQSVQDEHIFEWNELYSGVDGLTSCGQNSHKQKQCCKKVPVPWSFGVWNMIFDGFFEAPGLLAPAGTRGGSFGQFCVGLLGLQGRSWLPQACPIPSEVHRSGTKDARGDPTGSVKPRPGRTKSKLAKHQFWPTLQRFESIFMIWAACVHTKLQKWC